MLRYHTQGASALALAVAFVSLNVPPGKAQQGPVQELPTVEVTAPSQAPPSETAAPSGTEVTQSLTVPTERTAADALRQVPGGTDFIEASFYEKGRAANLEDILRYQPGVYVESRSNETKISIRGINLDRNFNVRGIKLLQDGVPITQADGDVDFQWIEPFAQRYVEVWRGANALQYGATTLGGAINFVSPTGYNSAPFQSRFEEGGFGYYKGQISSGQVLGNFDYYASLSGFANGGFQEHSAAGAGRFSSNFGYRFSPDVETRFYLGYVHSDLDFPGTLTKKEIRTDPRAADPAAIAFGQGTTNTFGRAANKTTIRLGNSAQLDVDVYWASRDIDQPLFWNPFFLNKLGILDIRSDTIGGDLRFVDTEDLFAQKNNLVVGFGPNVGFLTDKRSQNRNSRRGALTANGDETATNLNFYGENQHYFINDLALITGLPISDAARNYIDKFVGNPNGNQTQYRKYFGVSPKVGLLYDLLPTAQVYTNFSRSFEPPTFVELVGTGGVFGDVLTVPLKAQRASTAKIGTRGAVDRVPWDVTYYHSWVQDELLTLNDAQGNPRGTVNGTPTRHQGIESGLAIILASGLFVGPAASEATAAPPRPGLGLGFAPLQSGSADRIVLRQIFNWNDFNFVNDPVNGHNRLPGIPEHLYQAELVYEHPSGFYAGPNVEWAITKFPADYANTLFASPYAVFGIKAGYQAETGWSGFLEVRNLTDKRYASAVDVIPDARTSFSPPRVFRPGEGRGFYGGVQVRW